MSSRSIRVLRSHVPNRKGRPFRVERLEERALLSVITVNDPGDSGAGTLRNAILQADLDTTPDTIDFNIGGGGHQVITPSSALPAITNTVTIDGASQPGYSGAPLVEINGDGLDIDEMTINAANSTVRGLIFNDLGSNAADTALQINAPGVTVQSCYFGTDWTGETAAPTPIGIALNATGCLIGGTSHGVGNIISGNARYGIDDTVGGNTIQGNFIGTDATGTKPLGNSIGVASLNDLIGGPSPSARNVISGNSVDGVFDTSNVAAFGGGSLIEGNFVGTDVTGEAGLSGRSGVGLLLDYGQGQSVVGNVVSANDTGIVAGTYTIVQGNLVGTDATGKAAIGNNIGIGTDHGPSQVTLIGGNSPGQGNLVSGNIVDGIQIPTGGVSVEGNKIGTDITGTFAIPNATGILTVYGSDTIGGTTPGAGNLISGNSSIGVEGSYLLLQGNFIGTDVTGTKALGNGTGVFAYRGSVIGGTTPSARNIIAGNVNGDVHTQEATLIEGNYIGLDVTGEMVLSTNALVDPLNATVGGIVPGAGNVIAGTSSAVLFSSNSTFQGNLINTNKEGTQTLGQNGFLLRVEGGSGNTVGGATPGSGNLIRGGIVMIGSTVTANVFQGNTIDGYFPILDGAHDNLIGGTAFGDGNVINGEVFLADDAQSVGADGAGNAILGNAFPSDDPGRKPISITEYSTQSNTSQDIGAVNDPGDADTGPNGAQNDPVLTAAGSGPSTSVSGTLNSTAGDTFRIEFYASAAGDPAGQGKAQRYLGYTTVVTDANGNATFNVNGLAGSATGEEITATATVLTGPNANSTSEVSAWIAANNPQVQPTFSNLAGPSITYGTPTVTLGGTIAAGTQIPSGTVAITVAGVTQNATIQPNGAFSTVFNTASLGTAGSPYPITYAFAAAGNYLAASDSSRTLTVTAAATSLTLTTSATPSVPGQYVTFTSAASAASGVPTPTGTIVFADGTVSLGSVSLQNGVATITLPLATLGTHAITATYVPANANYAPPAQPSALAQAVQPVALEAGAQAGQSVLYVGGTAYNDVIDIEVEPKSSSQDRYEVTILTLNGRSLSEFDSAGTAPGHIVKVVGLANGQNDLIAVDCGSSTASWLYGGPGNNLLSGGDGNNVLVGGAGDNILFGGVGRSLLIGGAGPSALFAGSGDSILIGGTTSFDSPTSSHFAAFDQVMAEWTSSDSYATRVADISGTGTGASFAARLNGNTFLTTSGAAATVFDNGQSDLLVGGSGMDWFFADLSNGADRDTVINQKRKEIVTPV